MVLRRAGCWGCRQCRCHCWRACYQGEPGFTEGVLEADVEHAHQRSAPSRSRSWLCRDPGQGSGAEHRQSGRRVLARIDFEDAALRRAGAAWDHAAHERRRAWAAHCPIAGDIGQAPTIRGARSWHCQARHDDGWHGGSCPADRKPPAVSARGRSRRQLRRRRLVVLWGPAVATLAAQEVPADEGCRDQQSADRHARTVAHHPDVVG